MAVHQCARLPNNPQLIHERAVRKIDKYLSETATRGIIYDPDTNQGIECYVDAEFAGGWDRKTGNGTIMIYLDLDIPYFMLGAQYYGKANCKRKLH